MTTVKDLFFVEMTTALGAMVMIVATNKAKKHLLRGIMELLTLATATAVLFISRQTLRTARFGEMTMGVVEHLKKEKETATVITTAKDLFFVETTTALGAMVMIVATNQELRSFWPTLATPHPHN